MVGKRDFFRARSSPLVVSFDALTVCWNYLMGYGTWNMGYNARNPYISASYMGCNARNPFISASNMGYNERNPYISATYMGYNARNPCISGSYTGYNARSP